MAALCTGLITVLVWKLSGCLSEVFTQDCQQDIWRKTFTTDVVAPGASFSTAARSKLDCVFHCLQLEDCKTLAFHHDNATCWLYRHLVVYGTTGMASPGTHYFWRLSPSCPGELGYQLDAGICLKVYTTAMTRMMAEDTCRKDGGHLLIADTAEKRNAVLQKAGSEFWLGASDKDKEGEWRWSNGTLMTDNTIWVPGQPSNDGGNEHYLKLRSTGQFSDVPARNSHLPACQIPLQ